MFPLRVVPLEIRRFTPTKGQMGPEHQRRHREPGTRGQPVGSKNLSSATAVLSFRRGYMNTALQGEALYVLKQLTRDKLAVEEVYRAQTKTPCHSRYPEDGVADFRSLVALSDGADPIDVLAAIESLGVVNREKTVRLFAFSRGRCDAEGDGHRPSYGGLRRFSGPRRFRFSGSTSSRFRLAVYCAKPFGVARRRPFVGRSERPSDSSRRPNALAGSGFCRS